MYSCIAEQPLLNNQLTIEVTTSHQMGEIFVDIYDIEKKKK